MKTMLKKVGLALAIGVLSCVCLVGCGAISMDDIKGDWTTDTMDGQALADYAAANGIADAGMLVSNWTIKDDKTLISENVTGTLEFDMELKSNGFELKQKGQSDIYCSVLFDKDAGTLSFDTKDANGGTVKCVMKKGKGELSAGQPAGDETSDDAEATEGDDTSEAEDADTEDSSDDSEAEDGSEDGSEDESGDEVEDESGDEEE
ncbi:MAG: hypothetical protein VZQ83_04295 [Eubacterium sp.]|nr:hypothetical protein [Eubacterium sp.]